MKPLLLTLEGLQSYRDKQTVDFSLIQDCGLFGIFGPTGSGKSTILDAMTLALFGTVTRASHNTQGIINSFCDSVAVSLTFELHLSGGRQIFRIDRVYRRKPKTPDSCEPRLSRLVRLDSLSDSEGRVLADKATEVSAAVEKLLGLRLDDFTRAVVLPQNQFQEFLLLGKKDKSDMLERLFCLEEYGQELSRKVALGRRKAEDEIRQAAGALGVLQDCSDEAVQALRQEAASRTLDRQLAAETQESCQIRYLAGKDLYQLVREKNLLLAAQVDLSARSAAIATDRRRLDQALAAEPAWPLWQENQQLKTEKDRLREDLRLLSDQAANFQKLLEANQEQLRVDRELGNAQKTDLDQRIRRQDLAVTYAGQAWDLRSRLDKIREEQAAGHRQEQEALERLQTAQIRLTQAQAQLEQLQQARNKRQIDPVWRQDLEKGLQLQEKLARLALQRAEATETSQKLAARLQELQDEYQLAGPGLAGEQAALAQEISAHLRDGEPCPVCGSEHHPQPAHLRGQTASAGSGKPGRADLQKQLVQYAERMDANRQQMELVIQEIDRNTLDQDELILRSPRLAAIADAGPVLQEIYRWESEARDLDRQLKAAEKELGRQQEACQEAANLKSRLSGLAAGQERLQQELTGQYEQQISSLTALLPGVPACEFEPAQLRQTLQDLKQARREMDETSERLLAENGELSKQIKPLERQILTGQTQLTLADGRLEDLALRLEAAVRKAGFAAEAELAAARLDPDAARDLSARLKEFDDAWRDLELQMRQCDSRLQGRWLDETAWKQLETEYLAATDSLNRAVRADDLAAGRLAEILGRQKIRRQKEKEHADALARRDRIAQIESLIRGNAFVEYMAEDRLRDIIAEASGYLQTMTRFRFALELDSEMSFIIRDQLNGGEARQAASLSGGETFMASLALALALSSQIQIRGQSRLEFFFLDEGFGSLDSGMLDQVMDSLERISSPQRLIGLISHVPELRNRIGARLIITPADNWSGSRIRLEQA